MRAYRRKWYASNKEYAIKKSADNRKEVRAWFNEYKSTLKCEQCGENHSAVLDFHHINPNEKDLTVTQAVSNGRSKEGIMAEVEKCIVLCCNCHRKLHWEEKQCA